MIGRTAASASASASSVITILTLHVHCAGFASPGLGMLQFEVPRRYRINTDRYPVLAKLCVKAGMVVGQGFEPWKA